MDWIQFATFIITHILFSLTLWLWNRSESRSDIRNLEIKINENRKETSEMIRAIHMEIKDFHGRLCAIEEKRKSS